MPSLASMRDLPQDLPPLGERLPRPEEEPISDADRFTEVAPGIFRDRVTGKNETRIPTEADKTIPPTKKPSAFDGLIEDLKKARNRSPFFVGQQVRLTKAAAEWLRQWGKYASVETIYSIDEINAFGNLRLSNGWWIDPARGVEPL